MCRGTTSVGRVTIPSGKSGKSRSVVPDIGLSVRRPRGEPGWPDGRTRPMASTAIVWFRRDLRLHDPPPLFDAMQRHERVVPVFVLDRALIGGRFASGARTAWMLEALRELDAGL